MREDLEWNAVPVSVFPTEIYFGEISFHGRQSISSSFSTHLSFGYNLKISQTSSLLLKRS